MTSTTPTGFFGRQQEIDALYRAFEAVAKKEPDGRFARHTDDNNLGMPHPLTIR